MDELEAQFVMIHTGVDDEGLVGHNTVSQSDRQTDRHAQVHLHICHTVE